MDADDAEEASLRRLAQLHLSFLGKEWPSPSREEVQEWMAEFAAMMLAVERVRAAPP